MIFCGQRLIKIAQGTSSRISNQIIRLMEINTTPLSTLWQPLESSHEIIKRTFT